MTVSQHKHICPRAALYTHEELERIVEQQSTRIAELEAELARRPPPLEWLPRDSFGVTHTPAAGWYWVQYHSSLGVAWKEPGDSIPWRIAGPIPEPREPKGGRNE